jgi:2-aminoadipate transaminase
VPSALAAPRAADRVIYTGTYSKPFATGVRVGYGVLPQPVLRTVLRIKGNHDFGSSNLLQHLVAQLLTTGAYDRHLAELQKRYAHKARVMLEAMRQEFPPGVEFVAPAGGLYHWARVPNNLATGMKSRLFNTALENEVLYVPGQLCYAPDPTRPIPNHEMRLSFGAESEPKLQEGIRRLGAALRQLVGQTPKRKSQLASLAPA